MSAQHTPGPWRVSLTDDTVVVDATGHEVAAIDGDYNDPDTWPLMEANARVIAAAPDLLSALRCAKALLDNINEFGACNSPEIYDAADTAVRAAIAKAEGQP